MKQSKTPKTQDQSITSEDGVTEGVKKDGGMEVAETTNSPSKKLKSLPKRLPLSGDTPRMGRLIPEMKELKRMPLDELELTLAGFIRGVTKGEIAQQDPSKAVGYLTQTLLHVRNTIHQEKELKALKKLIKKKA